MFLIYFMYVCFFVIQGIFKLKAMENQLPDSKQLLDSIERSSQRALSMFVVGGSFGFAWGLIRGSGALWTYPLFIGGNCAFISLPCFAIREIIGNKLPDPAASTLAGSIGGFGAMAVYSGLRAAPKGAIMFGLAGLGIETMNQAFTEFKVKKRDELLKERSPTT